MAPIEVQTYYRNKMGKLVSSRGNVHVIPGCKERLTGNIVSTEVTCNPDDDGGSLKIVKTADDVKVGGFRGVGGFMGPKIVTSLSHSDRKIVKVEGRHGIDEFDVKHVPYPSVMSPIE